jgi:hypothetical protein
MRVAERVLFGLALLLILSGVTTCHFGVRHEIALIPPEQRARMTDTDWVGVEWAAKGLRLMEAGGGRALLGAVTRVLRLRARSGQANAEWESR